MSNLHIQEPILKPAVIPRDPQLFYQDFGGLPHPYFKDANFRPKRSMKLTQYQIDCWKYKGNLLAVKGNKIGLTTSFSLEDFQSRLLPEEAGYDCLLIAQNEKMAREHIKDLKKAIMASTKYRKYLIDGKSESTLRESKSKMSYIYIANPYDPSRESRIIGVGSSEQSAFSWKNINRVHMSDVSLLKSKDQKMFFGGLYSRLMNTRGVVKIESIPNGQIGEVWNIYQKSKFRMTPEAEIGKSQVDDPEAVAQKFKVLEIPTREAIPYGLVSEEDLAREKREMGDLIYSQLYECNFNAPGNQWYKPEWFTVGDYIL